MLNDTTLKATELTEPCAACGDPASRECKCGALLCENCDCPNAIADGLLVERVFIDNTNGGL